MVLLKDSCPWAGLYMYVSLIFPQAFDKINSSILFLYKIMKNGCKGTVIDKFRSLYDKTTSK